MMHCCAIVKYVMWCRLVQKCISDWLLHHGDLLVEFEVMC